MAEADAVLFLVDGRDGLTGEDREIAAQLRKTGRPLWLVVNKSEGRLREAVAAEFHELGLGDPLPIAAAHGDGVHELVDLILESFPPQPERSAEQDKAGPRIAVVGRPNVGKSTLVNAILGEERVIAFDQPGTTRDSIYIEFERGGRPYTLIDRAGLRKRGKVEAVEEKFSVVKTLQAIEDANVAVLVLDARQDIAEQDAHVGGFILEAGRALVVAVNKWDGLDEQRQAEVKRDLERKLDFLSFARIHYIGTDRSRCRRTAGLDRWAYAAAMAKLSTPKLTRVLIQATMHQQPPRTGMFRPKLRYAHQGGMNPPTIVIHGNQLGKLPDSYRRYLERFFADAFELRGTPVRFSFAPVRTHMPGASDGVSGTSDRVAGASDRVWPGVAK